MEPACQPTLDHFHRKSIVTGRVRAEVRRQPVTSRPIEMTGQQELLTREALNYLENAAVA